MAKIVLDKTMLSVWEANMEKLRQLQPYLASKLDDWINEHGHEFEHEEMETPKGKWISGLTEEPFFQAAAPPQKKWDRKKEDKIPVVFQYGVGVPGRLFEVTRILPKQLLAMIVVEPNLALLAYTLHMTHIYLAIPGLCQLCFITSSDAHEISEAFRVNLTQLGTYLVGDSATLEHEGETAVFSEQIAKLQKSIHEQVAVQLTELGNTAEDTLLGLRQIALASPWIALGPSLGLLVRKFEGRPAVWVASGPSLNNNFRHLKGIEDRAVIVCADSALKKLLKEGIKPHVVVALERGPEVFGLFEKYLLDYPEEIKDILLVAQGVCVPEVVGKWPGPKIVVGKQELPVDRWLLGEILGGDLIHSGLSVAHMAMWLLQVFSVRELAIIGQDLAYGDDLVSHADSTIPDWMLAEEKARAGEHGENLYWIPGNEGKDVATNSIWLTFLRMMERFIPGLGFPVFNCTEGGARINGTETAVFKEWLEERVLPYMPLEETPAQIVRSQWHGEKISSDQLEMLNRRVDAGFQFIASTYQLLEEIEKQIERVIAPTLTAERRQDLAYVLSEKLDILHASNPVLLFIGQSITAINAADISKVRFLDSPETVAQWAAVHWEIVATHRRALKFMEEWLQYSNAAVRVHVNNKKGLLQSFPYFSLSELHNLEGREEEIWPQEVLSALDRIRESEDVEEILEAQAMLDYMIASGDHKWWYFWDSRIDWKMALALEAEGRVSEAKVFLEHFETNVMGIQGVPPEEAEAFWNDSARILASRDLCYTPDYDRARLCAQNAIGLNLECQKYKDTLDYVNEQHGKYIKILEVAVAGAGDRPGDVAYLDWINARFTAEKAVAAGDLLGAIEKVNILIKEFYEITPFQVKPYIEWVEKHLLRIDEAGIDVLGKSVAAAFYGYIKLLPLLNEIGVSPSTSFVLLLERKGVNIQVEPLAQLS